MTRHIRETFRSFPVADLAKMVLEARERYRIRFTATEPVRLNQCLADGSLWLSREEAISHLLSGPALEHYYTAEDIQIDPPAGNFAVIAVCGMSGVILGPPNHHEYQRNIARLHRERFSDMPLERFKSRIRMESGEEILEKWREQVSRVRQYRVKPAEQASPAEETPAELTPVEAVAEAATEEAVAGGPAAEEASHEEAMVGEISEESPEAEAPLEETESADAEEAEAPVLDTKADEGPVFKSFEEVGRHFREHFAPLAIVETAVAVVPGNIAGRLLSPGLLAHLRLETEKLRRGFPLAMIQSLCGEFERKGLKFFKRGKKSLHVSAVRPKALHEATNLTGAIQAIVDFVKTAPKPSVATLLEALVPGFKKPEGPTVDESPEWSDAARTVLKDLRWLTAEGYLLEFADTGLAIGRQPQENTPTPPKANKAKPAKEKSATPANIATTADTSSVEEAETPVEEAETPVEEAESSIEVTELPVEEAESSVEAAELPVEEAESSAEVTELSVDFKTDQEVLGDLSVHPVHEDGADSENPHDLPEDSDPVATL
ncbi:MAG: hypothetical protein B9S36_02520 [Verrucomicrobiia bacterium Tous-C2TDCM]|nr:MAG: hypothetical protein B9S36_02520 [Verrucomicrobiae bacterium Tous-C2TDCM]